MRKIDQALKLAEVEHIGMLYDISVGFGRKEKHTFAEKIFSRIVKLDPDNYRAWNNKGIALANLGKHREAIKCYDKAIEIDPNHFAAWVN